MALQSFGANLVDSLSAGLRGLAEWKMSEIQQQKAEAAKNKQRAFYKSQGLHPGLADLPQEQQSAAMKEFLLREGYPQQQQLQGSKPYWAQGVQRGQQPMQQGQEGRPDIQSLLASLGSQGSQGPQTGMNRLQDVLNQGGMAELLGGMNPQQDMQQQVNPDFQPQQGQNIPEFQPNQPQQGMKPRRLSPEAEERNKIAREQLSLAQEKNVATNKRAKKEQEFKEFQAIKPFLHQRAEDAKNQRTIKSKATEALKLINTYGKDFPGILKGNLPGAAQSVFIRNPHVRKYMSLLQELVLARVHSRKGIPSKYKIMMEEAAKANVNQPIQTQKDLLQFFVDDADTTLSTQRYISSLNKNGRYPLDIEQKVSDYESAQKNPFEYPQFYKEGTRYEDDDGKVYRLKNGTWKEL